MIEGTKTFKGKNSAPTDLSTTNPTPTAKIEAELSSSDAMNPDRRTWFTQIIPAMGSGLVQILRGSNHLKEQLSSQMENTKHKKE